MGLKNKVQILLFPVTLAAGIVTGIAIERTKRKAARIAVIDAAASQELPAEETALEQTGEETEGTAGAETCSEESDTTD